MLETNVIYNESCLDTCRRLPDNVNHLLKLER